MTEVAGYSGVTASGAGFTGIAPVPTPSASAASPGVVGYSGITAEGAGYTGVAEVGSGSSNEVAGYTGITADDAGYTGTTQVVSTQIDRSVSNGVVGYAGIIAGASSYADDNRPDGPVAGSGPIDYEFISQREGGQQTQGYVPAVGTSQSGVTVGTGVDIGQMSVTDIENLDISQALKTKLEPYAGFTGQNAVAYLANNPLTVTPDEANALDQSVMKGIVDSVARSYDDASSERFSDLPSEAKTVIADLATQYGSNLAKRTPHIWGDVTQGRWEDAVKELRNFGDNYPGRRNAEADLLQKAIDRGAL